MNIYTEIEWAANYPIVKDVTEAKMLIGMVGELRFFTVKIDDRYSDIIERFQNRITELIEKNNEGIKVSHVKQEGDEYSLIEYPDKLWSYEKDENWERSFLDYCNDNKLYVINRNILDTFVREGLNIHKLIYNAEENSLYQEGE